MSTGRTDHRAVSLTALLAASLALAAPAPAQDAVGGEAPARPNIIVVVLDDIGFTDLGAYGGEMRTPNFDRLAADGAQFSNFRTAPTCAPTRAMLLTGIDNHRTGVPTLEHLMVPEYQGAPGYEGELQVSAATLAEHLAQAGYQSFAVGKWHVGSSETSRPSRRGFERSFILDSSGADNWEHRPYIPHYARAEWWEDDAPVDSLPDDFYSSEFLVDRLIDYIDARDQDRPFFALLGFQANHIPVQAPREFVERYDGVYDAGWEALRAARHEAAIARGLVPEGTPLAPVPPNLTPWAETDPEARALSIASRQVAAGMLEAADHHFGRLLARLEEAGELSNTVIVLLSDNGPEHNAPGDNPAFLVWQWIEGYEQDLDRLGEQGTYAWIGPEWASASASPLSLFKFHAAEGGIRVPLLIAGPGVEAQGIQPGFSMVTDIAPTLLDLAGVEPLNAGQPMTGRSLVPVLRGEAVSPYGPEDSVGIEMSGQIAFYRGGYKLVRSLPPYGDGVFRVFNIETDPGETLDLAPSRPDLLAELQAAYADWAVLNNVVPVPEGFDAGAEITRRGWEANMRRFGPWLALIGVGSLLVLGGIGLLISRVLRTRRMR